MRILVFLLVMIPGIASAGAIRLKDLVEFDGVRGNDLVGYGLVVGLNGTGDGLRNSPFTEEIMSNILERLGVNVNGEDFRPKNVAAVLVTAKLPAFANKGTRIDVNVSSLGDAASLRGGTLVFTALYGGDGEIYASAQGALVVSGFSAEGDAASVESNTPTAARIPNGAVVEKPAPGDLNDEQFLVLQLANPDFNTAVSITDRINKYTVSKYRKKLAREIDHRSIFVEIPKSVTSTRFYAAFSQFTIEPDIPARVIVDERTGTVIIGSEVKISRVAITHGGLSVNINEFPRASQPLPFSDGVTVVEPDTEIVVNEDDSTIGIIEGPDLNHLVQGLNMMGAKPSNIIAILQGIKSAGALQAELIVQ